MDRAFRFAGSVHISAYFLPRYVSVADYAVVRILVRPASFYYSCAFEIEAIE